MHINKDLVAASAIPLVLAILDEGESYGYAILKRTSMSCPAASWSGPTGCCIPCCIGSTGSATSRRGGTRRRVAGGAGTTVTPRGPERPLRAASPVGGRLRGAPERLAFLSVLASSASGASRGLTMESTIDPIEAQIREWRTYLLRRRTIDHRRRRARGPSAKPDFRARSGRPRRRRVLPRRDQADRRCERAVQRVRPRASSRLWKQLVLAGDNERPTSAGGWSMPLASRSCRAACSSSPLRRCTNPRRKC